MKTAKELLDELNTLDEHTTIEAKTASEVGQSLLETVCAFAKEPQLGGGYILCGVACADDSFWPVYEARGVPDADKLQQAIATQCASAFNVPIRPTINAERIGTKTVLTVFVPEAGPHEKPVHFKNQPLPQSARRRIGSTDQRCTEDDLIVFYQGRMGQTYDEQIVADSSLTDLDEEAIDLYRQLRREVDAQAEELSWDNNDLLESLGAAKQSDGILKPTVAGVLLFGSTKALRRLFPMLRIDYIRVPGVQWVKDPDRRFDTIEIRAPLLRAIQRTRAAILDDLPKAFSLPAGQVQGQEIPLLPDRVIREVVANAVMHRDYRVHGSIQIIRYANRLEVRNPGYSLKADERLGQPGSETRNPRIAAVLHDVKFAETKGSGIRVMRELMDERDLSMPLLQSDRTGNSFLAMLLFHHFLSQEDLDWLESFADLSLSEDEMKAMISAREVGAIDNATYRDINRGTETHAASRHLRRLCEIGLLEKKGQSTATYYVPTGKALANWPPVKKHEFEGKKHQLEAKKHKLAEEKHKLAEEKHKLAEEKHKLAEEKHKLAQQKQELSDELLERIAAQGGKGTKPEILNLVEDLLKVREMSAAELAKHLDRTPVYVRRTYIKPLVEAGRIVSSNPENPTDPGLTYRSVSSGDSTLEET
ncbi:MAG: ATP-binding protein [Planctomycetaceae bacterium]